MLTSAHSVLLIHFSSSNISGITVVLKLKLYVSVYNGRLMLMPNLLPSAKAALRTPVTKELLFVNLCLRLSGVVVSALGIRARVPGFESQVVPLFHWPATLGKLFAHIAFPVSQLQETGVRKGAFGT